MTTIIVCGNCGGRLSLEGVSKAGGYKTQITIKRYRCSGCLTKIEIQEKS